MLRPIQGVADVADFCVGINDMLADAPVTMFEAVAKVLEASRICALKS